MKKIKYVLKRILFINYKQMFSILNKVHNKSGISKIKIFFDMIYCGFRHGAGYMDYDLFEMYKLNEEERKTIMTRGRNNEIIKAFNDKEFFYLFDDKVEFNNKFNKYLKRDWLLLNNNFDDFVRFCENKDEIIVKPIDGSCGKDIKKISINDKIDLKVLYSTLINDKTILVEEVAKQNKIISKLHKESVNTIRIVTLTNKYGITSIVAAFIRIGTGDNVVDNFNHGGICSPVDLEKGFITHNAVDKQGNIYEKHPDSNITLVGYQLPLWDKVISLVMSSSKVVKEVGVVGWDICIGDNDVLLIEGNQFPGHDIYQLPAHRDGNIGVVPIFVKAINKQK